MKWQWESVSPAFVLTGAVVFFSSLFQIGYFFAYGLSFLSMVGLGDWVFFSGVLSVGMIPLALILTGLVMRKAEGPIRRGDALFVMVAVIVVALGFYLIGFSIMSAAGLVLNTGFVLLLVSSSELRRKPKLKFPFLLVGIVAWGSQTFWAGSEYFRISGQICTFTFDDGRQWRALYKRSVTEGHLVVLDGRRYFLAKDTVREIQCVNRLRSDDFHSMQGEI